MSQLQATKPGLLVCTAVCIFIFIYLRNLTPEEAEEEPTHPAVVECGFYPDELCSALFEGKEAAPQIAKFCRNPHGSEILAHLHRPEIVPGFLRSYFTTAPVCRGGQLLFGIYCNSFIRSWLCLCSYSGLFMCLRMFTVFMWMKRPQRSIRLWCNPWLIVLRTFLFHQRERKWLTLALEDCRQILTV